MTLENFTIKRSKKISWMSLTNYKTYTAQIKNNYNKKCAESNFFSKIPILIRKLTAQIK